MIEREFDEDDFPLHGLAMTVEAFEDLVEHEGPYHYEMIDGVVYNMAPPSQEHDVIAYNIRRSLADQIGKQGPCRVMQDQRVAIPGEEPSVEPDVLVTCNISDWSKKYRKPKNHRIEQPLIVVEILSLSTQQFDRTEKFARYITIPSLEVYLLVHQDKELVEVYRSENGWTPELFTSGQTIHLDQMDPELPLSEIYDDVFTD
jgi:Uma2 family endonuclease